MRYAIVSDLHANLAAWEAVAEDINRQQIDQLICLGDVVGYGPCPEDVLASIRETADYVVLGNHDAAACGLMDTAGFSDIAVRSIEWTREQLAPDLLAFLKDIPLELDGKGFGCVHGEPSDPSAFYYLESEDDAREAWRVTDYPILFIGHTHVPMIHRLDAADQFRAYEPGTFRLNPKARYIINVGSVGLPRDGDVRASYVLYDDEKMKITWRRVAYDMETHIFQVRQLLGTCEEHEFLYRQYQQRKAGTRRLDRETATREFREDFTPGEAVLAAGIRRNQIRVSSRKQTITVRRGDLQQIGQAARPQPSAATHRKVASRSKRRYASKTWWLLLVVVLAVAGGVLGPRWIKAKHEPDLTPPVSTHPQPQVHLADLEPVNAITGWGDVQRDRSLDGNPIQINGQVFERGIGVNAYSELSYRLDPGYLRFVAVAGLDDEVEYERRGSVTFEVWVDGLPGLEPSRQLFESPVIQHAGPRRVDIDVILPSGARELKLVVTHAGDGFFFDHADWADAGFILKEDE